MKTSRQNKQNDIPYPKLMGSKNTELVILMLRKEYGVVLIEDEEHSIGFIHNDWNEKNLEIFQGIVTIQN